MVINIIEESSFFTPENYNLHKLFDSFYVHIRTILELVKRLIDQMPKIVVIKANNIA